MNYEGRSIWKIAARAETERRFEAADLRALLERRGEALVLVKRENEAELRALLAGFEATPRARGGAGKSEALALHFRRP